MFVQERKPKLTGEEVIKVEGVSKTFRIYHEKTRNIKDLFLFGSRTSFEELQALRNVSFSLKRGEMLGIIGENGSGKSTMLKILAKILRPTEGKVWIDGKVSALLELGAGFHPDLTGKENVYINGSILGLTKRQIRENIDDIFEFSELERFKDTPVKNYSSGMYMRLAFAIAINVDPDILLVDEVLSVGDEAFQRKCMDKFYEFKNREKSIVLVSHDLNTVSNLCDTVMYLRKGEAVKIGKPEEVVSLYVSDVNKVLEERSRGQAESTKTERGNRWGSKEIEITSVRLLNADGVETDSFNMNDKFVAHIEYSAKKKINRPVFGVAINRRDGLLITGPNTKASGITIKHLEGEGWVRYIIPSLPLMPDTYFFTVAVYDYMTVHPFDHHEQMYSFKVKPGGEKEKYGLVKTPCEWQIR